MKGNKHTLQLEFRYLSFLTNNDRYWEAVEWVRISLSMYLNLVMRVIKAASARLPSFALVPIYRKLASLLSPSAIPLTTVQRNKWAVLSFQCSSWFARGFVLWISLIRLSLPFRPIQ